MTLCRQPRRPDRQDAQSLSSSIRREQLPLRDVEALYMIPPPARSSIMNVGTILRRLGPAVDTRARCAAPTPIFRAVGRAPHAGQVDGRRRIIACSTSVATPPRPSLRPCARASRRARIPPMFCSTTAYLVSQEACRHADSRTGNRRPARIPLTCSMNLGQAGPVVPENDGR